MIKSWKRQSFGSKVFDVVLVIFILALLVVFIYPLLNITAISLSGAKPVIKGQVGLWPKEFTIESYKFIFRDTALWRSYMNTIIYAGGFTLIHLAVTTLLSYPLARRDFVFSTPVTIFLTITMFFSGGLIPTYLLMTQTLHLKNSIFAIILPGTVSAYTCFVFRTFFRNIPGELSESAYLDGASDPLILWKIIVPLSKPLLATFAIFAIVGRWNSWFAELLYLDRQEMYPLQLLLRSYLFQLTESQLQARSGVIGTSNPLLSREIQTQSVRMAMVVVTMFPIMVVYPYFQRFFMQGVMVGAIKG